MGYLTISSNFRRYQTHDIFSFRKTAHWCLCSVHVTQSNCCDFLSPEPCSSNSSELSSLTTRFRESYSSLSMSCESKRLKKSRSNWLNSGNALIQHLSEKKCGLRVSPFCQVAQKHKAYAIWGGIVKRLLIAYFIGNISAKNVEMRSRMLKLANQRLDVFTSAPQCSHCKRCTIFQAKFIWLVERYS